MDAAATSHNLAKYFGYRLKEALAAEGVDESAVTPQQASQENLALYVSKNRVILYDWQNALARLSKAGKETGFADERTDLQPVIKGSLYFDRLGGGDKDAMVIEASAAEPGYGPLMYDLVMTLIYPKYLMADRGSVSKSAFGVWQYYLKNRPDVQRKMVSSAYREIEAKKGSSWGPDLPDAKGTKEIHKAFDKLRDLEDFRDTYTQDWKDLRKGGWKKWGPTKERWEKDLQVLAKKVNALNVKIVALQQKTLPLVMANPMAFKYRTRIKAGSIQPLTQRSQVKFFGTPVPGWTSTAKKDALEYAAQQFFNTKYNG